MKIPVKKLKNGFEIPTFGIGTWMTGGAKVRDLNNDDKGDISAIQTAIQMGITHIDTAENYAEGHAETIVGEAIKNFNRSSLFVVSKVGKTHLRYDDVISSAMASLKRLQTDYLDLYLIHSPSLDVPLKETIRAFDWLKENGLIKNIGVSNFKKERLEEAQTYTKNQIIMNQVYYSLVIREPERTSLLSYCQQNDVILEAYRPIERGVLLAKKSSAFESICKKYNKTKAQIALNWLISQENVTTICKMKQKNHIEENLGAIGWDMDKKDIELLRKEFPDQIERSESLPLK